MNIDSNQLEEEKTENSSRRSMDADLRNLIEGYFDNLNLYLDIKINFENLIEACENAMFYNLTSCDKLYPSKIVKSIKKHPKNKKIRDETPATDWENFEDFFRSARRKNQCAPNVTKTYHEAKANVLDSNIYPLYFICKILVKDKYKGNGTVVGNHTILTCAHLFNKIDLKDVSFAMFDVNKKIFDWHSENENLEQEVPTKKDWMILETSFDIIQEFNLKEKKFNTKVFQMMNQTIAEKDACLSSWLYQNDGAKIMTKLSCSISEITSGIAYHNGNTQPGHSGAPIYKHKNEIPYIYAIHLKEGELLHEIIELLPKTKDDNRIAVLNGNVALGISSAMINKVNSIEKKYMSWVNRTSKSIFEKIYALDKYKVLKYASISIFVVGTIVWKCKKKFKI